MISYLEMVSSIHHHMSRSNIETELADNYGIHR